MTDFEVCQALDKWEKRRGRFSTPQNDLERARLHYEGALIWSSKIQVIKQIVSFLLFPLVYVLVKRKDRTKCKHKKDAIITCPDKNFLLRVDDLPDKLKNDYQSYERIVIEKNWLKDICHYRLDESGCKLARELAVKYPHTPLLYFSTLLHLTRTYMMIRDYAPKAIITTQTEQDFTSSIITYYCEQKGIKYICVQHGEYCYNPSMAYMRFTEYYAWNKETVEILELTNTAIEYACLYTPQKFKNIYKKMENRSCFLKYYLSSGDTIHEITKIRDVLSRFTDRGYKCTVRCHPRGYKRDDLKQLFMKTNIQIEDSTDMSIGASISDCDYVVAYRSTVLSEAIANAMPIIIDDVTHDVNILRRVHDINLTRADCLLTELIDKNLM